MPKDPGNNKGSEKAPSREKLSDVDQLIAEAEAAATAAQRAAVHEEAETTRTKKMASAETAARAEQLQTVYAAFRADDAFVEDNKFEEIWEAGEMETGIAPPEKIQEALDALRKTGEALRKFALIEFKTKELHAKMEELQKLHDRLFDKVQAATVDALEAIKKKHKGEETAFERRYKELTESPLVRGIEFDPNSPEAREKAAKQEIVEFIMRPLAEMRLKKTETSIANLRAKLAILEEVNPSGRDLWDFKSAAVRTGLKIQYQNPETWHWQQLVNEGLRSFKEQLPLLESHLARERLAFEVNRSVLEMSLADEHDEAMIVEASIQIRAYIEQLREHLNETSGYGISLKKNEASPEVTNRLAQKILGEYVLHGITMPNTSREFTNSDYELNKSSPPSHLLKTANESGGFGAKKWVQSQSEKYSFRARLPENLPQESVSWVLKMDLENMERNYNALMANYSHGVSGENGPEVGALIEAFPTSEALITKLFEGQGALYNLQLAHQKLDAGLGGKPSEENPKMKMPKALEKIGWKESKLGAWVEPGQNMRAVDSEYAHLLERLSKPQIEAERAFDVRSPDGEFHVYTTAQAINLLRRARRDARDIVQDTERMRKESEALRVKIEGETEAGKEEKEGLEAKVKRLETELEKEKEAGKKRVREIREELTERLGMEQRASETWKENTFDRKKVMDHARDSLREALKKKVGMFGGDNELRDVAKRVVGIIDDYNTKLTKN